MPLDITKLVGPAPDWTDETWVQRVDQAASLLFLHGYITMSQRSKVTIKLEKQFADGLASGAIVKRVETEAV